MTSADLPEFVRDYLVAQLLVRKPSSATPVAPPMWLEPRNGTPAPGEGATATETDASLVLGAWQQPGIAPFPYELFFRNVNLDVRLRTTDPHLAKAKERQLRTALCDKRNWLMGNGGGEGTGDIRVIESLVFRELQFLGSDEQGYDYVCEYTFWVYSPPL